MIAFGLICNASIARAGRQFRQLLRESRIDAQQRLLHIRAPREIRQRSRADPRDVVEVMPIAPGTARATSSSGSVTSISICWAGMLPVSISYPDAREADDRETVRPAA